MLSLEAELKPLMIEFGTILHRFESLERDIGDGRSYWQTSSGKRCLPIANQAYFSIGKHVYQ